VRKTIVKKLFGKSVKSRRFELGLTQEELANQSGLQRSYVSDVERGVRNPSLDSIERLAGALQVSIPILFQSPE
jgi:transcriptional regulator with XRE-family HTH domain